MENSKLIRGNSYGMENETYGAMLTGYEIAEAVKRGDISISDYNISRLNPNSYNLRLHPQLKVYKKGFGRVLDSHRANPTKEIIMPETGYILKPGRLYIGRTIERTGTRRYIPMINGRSSVGRLGISIHVTAGFGDIGFNGTWTLEITAVEPVIVYPGDEICQVCWFTPYGDPSMKYEGRYQGQEEATASKFYL